jgi:hypothetical protein
MSRSIRATIQAYLREKDLSGEVAEILLPVREIGIILQLEKNSIRI